MDAMLLQLRDLSAAKGQAAPFRRDLAKRPRGTGGKIPVKDCAIREELQKLSLWKSLCRNGGACLPFAADFNQIGRQHKKMGKLAEIWAEFMPQPEADWCGMRSFVNGVLTVEIVENGSSGLYAVKLLLQGGIERQILQAGKATGLRRIVVKIGEAAETLRPQRQTQRGS
jgi:hypothetical protein